MRNVTILLAVAAMLALTVPAYGDAYVWDGGAGTNSFHDPLNWDPNGSPVYPDSATVDDGSIVEISETLGTNMSLRLKNGSQYILSNGKLEQHGVSIGYYCGWPYDVPNKFTQTGGEQSYSYIYIGAAPSRHGTYRLEGGKIDLGLSGTYVRELWVGASTGAVGLFEIIGTGTTENPITMIKGSDFKVNSTSRLHIELNTDGEVTVIEARTALLDGRLTINDDAATGLVPYVSTVEVLTATTSLNYGNLDLGYYNSSDEWVSGDPNWTMATGHASSIVLTYVPEPATMVLLGIGGIGVLLRRKRR